MSTHSVQLELANDLCWTFQASSTCADWIQSFAATLSLPESTPTVHDTCRSVHVVSLDELPALLDELHYTSSLKTFDLGPLRIHPLPESSDLVYVVPDSTDHRQWLMSMWYAQYPLYPTLLKSGVLPVHAGFATHEGRGVLFAAPGGTGKSTTMRRLPADWTVFCDDEVWLVPTENGLVCHVLPTWSDLVLRGETLRRWDATQSHPVHAIVFLRQSASVNLVPLDRSSATNYVKQASEQILRRAWTPLPPPDMDTVRARVFELAIDTAGQLSGALLDLNLKDAFWEQLQDWLLGHSDGEIVRDV